MAARSQQTSTSPPLHLHRNIPLVSSCQTVQSHLKTLYVKDKLLTIPVIDIHGGAFMLGHSRMVSLPQVNDCLMRGWIVLVPNHRLCPAVNLLEGPMQDIRDLLAWIHAGHLDKVLPAGYSADLEKIAAFGTSSGGTLALALVTTIPRQKILVKIKNISNADPRRASTSQDPLPPSYLSTVQCISQIQRGKRPSSTSLQNCRLIYPMIS
jgi:acetyl esterase/lipase